MRGDLLEAVHDRDAAFISDGSESLPVYFDIIEAVRYIEPLSSRDRTPMHILGRSIGTHPARWHTVAKKGGASPSHSH